jgi:hypothetical protein
MLVQLGETCHGNCNRAVFGGALEDKLSLEMRGTRFEFVHGLAGEDEGGGEGRRGGGKRERQDGNKSKESHGAHNVSSRQI